MSSNIQNTKSLHVVFERKNLTKDPDYDYEFARRAKIDERIKDAEKNVNNSVLQKRADAMRGDFYRKKNINKRHAAINKLMESIKDSNIQEDVATDKFVDNVECMMHRFSDDLEKLQKIYKNVMKNLPKIEK